MCATKRSQFVSLEGAYHGHSIAAMSVGSSNYRKHFSNLLPNCHKLQAPLDTNAADQLEIILKNNEIAALIMEPIVCNLGVEIPTQTFMQRADNLCKQYGALLIMDEVMTGFMRTGKMFASEHFDIAPDIICMAKGITGGYGALGATIVTDKIAKSLHKHFGFYSTFGWHPIAVEAATANIAYILAHQAALEKNIAELSTYFVERLTAMPFQCGFKIRAKGLAMALVFDDPLYAEKIVSEARKNGVILSTIDAGVIALFPALTLDKAIAQQGLDRIANALGVIE